MHFLYLSNGNFLSQKEQTKLVGAELPGVVGGGVDLVAFSSVNIVSSSSDCFEVFIIDLVVYECRFIDFFLKKQKNTIMDVYES